MPLSARLCGLPPGAAPAARASCSQVRQRTWTGAVCFTLACATATATAPAGHAQGAVPSRTGSPPRAGASAPDSSYASDALRELIARAALAGQAAPASLRGYRVGVESEIAMILRTAAAREGAASASGGSGASRERALQVEQVESMLDWQRGGGLEQHITGHRSRAVTASVSALSYFRRPWVVPVLYGNRLQLLFSRDSVLPTTDSAVAHKAAGAPPRDVLAAVHPFADDRDLYYRFTGGDTAAVLQMAGRSIPVVRILVEPLRRTIGRTLLFRGEIDIDASRNQIVRMRGQFVVWGSAPSLLRRVFAAGWESVAFAELVNGEYDGRFWLPTEQRIEAQARTPLAGEFRPIIRVVSHFDHYALDVGADSLVSGERGTTSAAVRLTFAPRDSLNAFSGWTAEIGAATGAARASDFDDVAPDAWRPGGAPRFDWRAERLNDVLRYNRVEGAFTGVAGTLQLRDAAPGATLGGNLGWAWTEGTARGALWGRWLRGRTTFAGRAERSLANSNDFRPLLDYEQSLLALLATADDYDYVDRRSAGVSIARELSLPGRPLLRLETGAASDRSERARVRFGLVHLDSAFRMNRAVAEGSYVRTAVGLDVHPNVSGEFLEPGIGGGLWYERGDGTLQWQRVEARVAARHTRGAFTYAGRMDGIALFTRQILPQQMIEFGENEGLPGYSYKEFGGDRAVLARAAMSYELPFLHAPVRLGGSSGRLSRIYLPGISPSLALGVQGGWSDATTPTARATLALFGTRRDSLSARLLPATRPTGGVRSTVNVTLRLFGGTVGLGVAKPLDHLGTARGWRFVFGVGQPF
jgi:hypothetical protein